MFQCQGLIISTYLTSSALEQPKNLYKSGSSDVQMADLSALSIDRTKATYNPAEKVDEK